MSWHGADVVQSCTVQQSSWTQIRRHSYLREAVHKNQVWRPRLSLCRSCCMEQTVSQMGFTVLLTLIYLKAVPKMYFSPEHIVTYFVSAPGHFHKWGYTNHFIVTIIIRRFVRNNDEIEEINSDLGKGR